MRRSCLTGMENAGPALRPRLGGTKAAAPTRRKGPPMGAGGGGGQIGEVHPLPRSKRMPSRTCAGSGTGTHGEFRRNEPTPARLVARRARRLSPGPGSHCGGEPKHLENLWLRGPGRRPTSSDLIVRESFSAQSVAWVPFSRSRSNGIGSPRFVPRADDRSSA